MNTNQHIFFKKPTESYWLASTETTSYPVLDTNIKVDILIIGGGFVGFACAYQLLNAGFKIAILEGDHILNGVTVHSTAKITSQHGLIYNKIKSQMGLELARQYAGANQKAIQEIKRIAEELNLECDFIKEAAYAYASQEKNIKKIEQEIDTALELGIKAAFVDHIPFDLPIKAAVRFDNQAQFHPRKFTLGLAEHVNKNGVLIFEKSRAIDIESDKNYVVTTEQGKKVLAKKVIIATRYPFYNKHGLYFTRIYTERSYLLALRTKEKFPGGMYIGIDQPLISLRGLPTGNGEMIMIGGQSHKTGQGESTLLHYESLVNFAEQLFSIKDIPYRWSAEDCMSIDGLPYVGNFTANTPDLYVATGFQKWGMTNSVASSLIIRDLIINGASPWQDVYNPSRKTLMASAKAFVIENYNVAEQLVSGKLSPLSKKIDLSVGEAKVLKFNGERIGAYKDEGGKLHLVNTTCTHMGCELNWNSAEKSWDCPCHGSRFTYGGAVICGPAVKPLSLVTDVNTIKKLLTEDY